MTAAVAEPKSGDRIARQHGKFESWFLFFNRAIVIAMMAVMVTLVFTNVVTRYGFGFSLTWAEEFSQYLMVWIAFLAGGLALREGRHVAVEMLQDILAPGAKRRLRMVVAGLMALFFAVVGYYGVLFADFAVDMQTPMMNISLAIPYACVPIGMLFLLMHLMFIWRAYVAGEHEVSESLESLDEGDL